VWDYNVSSDRDVPGFTILENVDRRGFRCSVREHLPDGELLPFVKLSVTSPPIYEKNTIYTINDFDVRNLQTVSYILKSDNSGILKINLNGSSHEIGINKTGDKANICMASFTLEKEPIATSKEVVTLKISLLNKGIAKGEGIKASLSATRKSALVLNGVADLGNISINEIVASKSPLTFRIPADSVEIEKFRLKISDKSNNEWTEYFEIPIINSEIPEIKEFEIADGRKVTVAKEGINSETIVLGSGNGDGLANPGESVVILVKDSGKLWRANVIANGKYINPKGINIRESDNWGSYDYVGGSSKYSIPVISSDCPENQMIGFIVEYWLPDNPNHIIKQGRINLKVSGRDQTPPVMQWVRITGDNVIQAKIYDGAAVRNVKAKLILKDSPDKFFEVELVNDGTNGDRAKDDNVFSYQVPESKFGLYMIEISAADLSGNMMKKSSPDIFVLH
jgi:hypothetical protein